MKLSIGKKLLLSFAAIIGLMALSAVVVYVNVSAMRQNVHEVVDKATPAVQACDRLLNGVNQSLAALRGYLLFGGDNKSQAEYFRAERAEAWREIDESLENLQNYSQELDENARLRVDRINSIVQELRSIQQSAEEIGQTDENLPSLHLLRTQMLPQAKQIEETLTAMMDAEAEQDASPQRRRVFADLVELRASFAAALIATLDYQLTGNIADWRAAETKWQEYEGAFSRVRLLESNFSPEQMQLWARLMDSHKEFKLLPGRYQSLRGSGDENKAESLLAKKGMPAGKILKSEVEEVMMSAEKQKSHLRQQLDESGNVASATLIAATIAAVLLATGVAMLLSRHLVTMVRALSEQAGAIASGDLRGEGLRTKSSDELGQLAEGFNVMLANLKDLTGQVLSVTENVNSAASQISSSASQQASSTKQQASTVQEISTTMREISETGSQIIEKAKELATSAEASTQASQSGITAVQETSRTMEAIREQVEEVAQNIVALSEKTQAIGDIVATVNEVAEQSNLLALNATIEAASAGEQGNRFSVVANEMKNLADQAKQCTVQVRNILGEIQKGINSSVMLTEEAVKRVESGKQRTQVTEDTIRQMSQNTDESVQAFQLIIGATNQQQIGFEQVTQGMEEIREAAQQTASGTSQLEQAVSSLSALSRQLKTAVGSYQV